MNNINLNVGKVFNIELETDICCEYCLEIVANYLDCPICNICTQVSSINLNYFEEETITCINCNSKFKLVGDTWYNYGETIDVILIKVTGFPI